MKIFQNVLSNETLDIIHSDIDKLKYDLGWSAGSLLIWEDHINRNITGVVVSRPIDVEICSLIKNELKLIIPEKGKLRLTYNIWHPNSGIAWHNDYGYLYGFTLYLNGEWNLDWGGLFMWEDAKTNEYKMFPPQYNSLVLNDSKEFHAVSIISPTVSNYRLTIQGFCSS